MADIHNTKAKLLRGVVQDNVDIVQGVRTKYPVKHRLSFRYWLTACIAMVGIAYLAIPAQVTFHRQHFAQRSDRHGFRR